MELDGMPRVEVVFPARAGMIPRMASHNGERVSIPRESGDDPNSMGNITGALPYSPRERG